MIYSFFQISCRFFIVNCFVAIWFLVPAYSFQNAVPNSEALQAKHKFAILFEQSKKKHQSSDDKVDHQFLKDFFDNEDDPTDNSGSLAWLDRLGDLEREHGHFNEARKIYNNDLMRRMIFYEKHAKVFSTDEGAKLLINNPTMKMRYNLAAKSFADKSIKIAEFEETQKNPDDAQEYYRIALEIYQIHQFKEELEIYTPKIRR